MQKLPVNDKHEWNKILSSICRYTFAKKNLYISQKRRRAMKFFYQTIFSLHEYRKTLLSDQFNVLIVEYWLLLVHHNTDCLVRHWNSIFVIIKLMCKFVRCLYHMIYLSIELSTELGFKVGLLKPKNNNHFMIMQGSQGHAGGLT